MKQGIVIKTEKLVIATTKTSAAVEKKQQRFVWSPNTIETNQKVNNDKIIYFLLSFELKYERRSQTLT